MLRKRKSHNSFGSLWYGLALAVVTSCASGTHSANHAGGNLVAAFLIGAELQVEAVEQQKEIQRALTDMRDMSGAELRKQTYADYEGNVRVWPVTKLLTSYFVPPRPMALDPASFYQDVEKPEAKAAIRVRLDQIARQLSRNPP
jgi:hypothetical protein